MTTRNSEKQQKKNIVVEKSKKLKGKVKPNSISMNDILKEIELVRKAPARRGKGALDELMKEKKWEIEHDRKKFGL